MKHLILLSLVITFCSFELVAAEIESVSVQRPDTIVVPDSLDLFRDITDISKQIERRTVQSQVIDETINAPSSQTNESISGNIYVPEFPSVETSIVIPKDTIVIPKNPLDSLYFRKENGTLMLHESSSNFESMRGLTFKDTLFYNPLFLPMIFTGDMLPRELTLYPKKRDQVDPVLIPREQTFAPRLNHIDFIWNVRRNYYMNYPDKIKYSVASFDTIPQLVPNETDVKESFNPFRELIKAETTFSLDAPGVEKIVIGRKYWVRSGEHSFQFAQNYFSDNWHKGGANNLNFNSYQVFRANYKKEKVSFNNTLEWRLSISNAPDDSLRKYRIGNDLIRYYGNFGIDAFGKGWSYSMNTEAKSQMLNSYPVNSNDLRSSFLSPLYVNAGVGLTYVLNKTSQKVRGRNMRLELAIAPISINYTYVWNDSVDVKRFGIVEGKKSQLDLGSTLTAIMKYNITKYITWDSKLVYFTSYDKVVADFENSLNMALSNAFSTRLYVNTRFDDGVPPDPKFKFLQMNQTLSFGLNYKW